MPLYRCQAGEAIKLRKANEFSFWGSRDASNRVEPIASPHFDLDVSLGSGDKIFTVGSCFARNVEAKLAASGFRLPMHDLMDDPSFAGVQPGALNNFSTPSIWNELAWATGKMSFDPEQAVVEFSPGKWVDLHVTHNVRPAARETVLRRRSAISAAYGSFVDCKLIVITLGLVEVWYDAEARIYLNSIPPPSLIRQSPERFELHVLDYAETLDYCDRAIGLLREFGRSDAVILLSVSPVALGVTHRPQDVITANCYSKSVLRAVAEQIVARHQGVFYFPSFESVTLSDRNLAWANDFTHATDLLIAHNVDRLVRKLATQPAADTNLRATRDEINAGGASAAYLHAVAARNGDSAAADRFFAEFGAWSERSRTFAVEHVEWLVEQRRAEKALEIACLADVHNERMALAKARALLLLRRPAQATAILYDPLFERSRSKRYWSLRVEAEGKLGDLAALETSLAGWCRTHPKKSSLARTHVARAMLAHSSVPRALELLDLALAEDSASPLAHMLRAEAYLLRGDHESAARSFAKAEPKTTSEGRRYSRLKDRIGEMAGV